MNPTVKALKGQILRTHPSKLRQVIQEKFVGEGEDLFSKQWLTDALAAAIRERPSIADAICPWLLQSDNDDLVNVLVEILPAQEVLQYLGRKGRTIKVSCNSYPIGRCPLVES